MDAREIEALVFGYCRALDRLDSDLLRSIFHDDAQIELGAIYQGGPDGFVPVAMGFMGSMQATRHRVTNILEVAGGIESYVDAWHLIDRDGRLFELLVRARYLQRVEARGGRLAIAYHSEVIDFGEERPVDDAWFSGEIGMTRGERGSSDPSYRLQAT